MQCKDGTQTVCFTARNSFTMVKLQHSCKVRCRSSTMYNILIHQCSPEIASVNSSSNTQEFKFKYTSYGKGITIQ